MSAASRRPHQPGQAFGFAAGVPIGSVTAYAGQLVSSRSGAGAGQVSTADMQATGWMLCDGSSLPRAAYPELYASIGTLYGGSGDEFCIPDLRGYFLRGADPDANVDRDAATTRTALGSGGTAGVATRQGDALRNHVHLAAAGGVPVPQAGPPVETAVGPNGPIGVNPPDSDVIVSKHETRPVNIAVHYLIRFTNRRQHGC